MSPAGVIFNQIFDTFYKHFRALLMPCCVAFGPVRKPTLPPGRRPHRRHDRQGGGGRRVARALCGEAVASLLGNGGIHSYA